MKVKVEFQFQEKWVKNLTELFSRYTDDLTKFAEMVRGVSREVTRLGLFMIEEELESYDQIMGLEKHARISEDAQARILGEAVESSYRKGGMNACIGEQEASKEIVMKRLHALEFPLLESLKEKRKARHLYIDADEDHVSLQYLEKKGDIKQPRTNTVMPRLIYVYEDVDYDGSKHGLVHCSYFGGDYAGAEGTKELWQEVFGFIRESYDEDLLERIYQRRRCGLDQDRCG